MFDGWAWCFSMTISCVCTVSYRISGPLPPPDVKMYISGSCVVKFQFGAQSRVFMSGAARPPCSGSRRALFAVQNNSREQKKASSQTWYKALERVACSNTQLLGKSCLTHSFRFTALFAIKLQRGSNWIEWVLLKFRASLHYLDVLLFLLPH